MRIYTDLVDWYPLLTNAADYAVEAGYLGAVIRAVSPRAPTTLLELGAGAGHLASHLTGTLRCTLTDRSPRMLALSRGLNPSCDHVVADMRRLALDDRFDVVLAHDAIGHMTTEADLAAAIATAANHLVPGGVGLFIPDDVKDRFADHVDSGGSDAADGRALRYLEWAHDPDPGDTAITVDLALMLRRPGQPVEVVHDSTRMGLFDHATWCRLLGDAGLEPVAVDLPDPYADQRSPFITVRR